MNSCWTTSSSPSDGGATNRERRRLHARGQPRSVSLLPFSTRITSIVRPARRGAGGAAAHPRCAALLGSAHRTAFAAGLVLALAALAKLSALIGVTRCSVSRSAALDRRAPDSAVLRHHHAASADGHRLVLPARMFEAAGNHLVSARTSPVTPDLDLCRRASRQLPSRDGPARGLLLVVVGAVGQLSKIRRPTSCSPAPWSGG